MPERPTLYVCHGDAGGPKLHPCRRVIEALDAAGLDYEKVIAGKGSPLPFLRSPRPELQARTGTDKLPTLHLADGSVISGSRAIIGWVKQQPPA